MKKLKKKISLNKLVISKLTNFTSIVGGSSACTDPISDLQDPDCKPTPPPKSKEPTCTILNTHMDC